MVLHFRFDIFAIWNAVNDIRVYAKIDGNIWGFNGFSFRNLHSSAMMKNISTIALKNTEKSAFEMEHDNK